MADPESAAEFWNQRRAELPELPEALPEVWGFGAVPAHVDELLGLVLAGVKTGTASSLWDYEATGDALPEVGDYSVILDGAGAPRAVIQTTALEVVPFHRVDAEHARAEGEGDRTLAHWRTGARCTSGTGAPTPTARGGSNRTCRCCANGSGWCTPRADPGCRVATQSAHTEPGLRRVRAAAEAELRHTTAGMRLTGSRSAPSPATARRGSRTPRSAAG